ncbi:MAG: isoprenoid biosynthesis glyoxalase ElbB [Thermodesulfobacteriota bacterium]
MASVGIILSGCGVNDGTEIQEAVSAMICLDKKNADISFFAPDINQKSVIDHTKASEMSEKRNVKTESARICRGNIQNIKNADPYKLDAVIIPGGAGAIKNWSDIFENPDESKVNPDLENLLNKMHELKKPTGAICISPVLVTAALKEFKPEVTIGTDINTAKLVESLGGVHKKCLVSEIHFDKKNLIVSTPAYMLASGPYEVYQGVEKLVAKIIELCA